MLCMLTVRRLKPDKEEEFREAWAPDRWHGRMVRAYHLRSEDDPDGDIELVFTGLRPGEKLYEELLIGDNPAPTEHERIMMANEKFLPLDAFEAGFARICDAILRQDPEQVRRILAEMVSEYRPSEGLVDHLRDSPNEPHLRLVRSPDLRTAAGSSSLATVSPNV